MHSANNFTPNEMDNKVIREATSKYPLSNHILAKTETETRERQQQKNAISVRSLKIHLFQLSVSPIVSTFCRRQLRPRILRLHTHVRRPCAYTFRSFTEFNF